MIMSILRKFFPGNNPDLDWIQIGVTSRCNARCAYCPHWGMRKTWKGVDMPFDVFKNLSPAFSRTDLVYLQGWGEPLLHPDFFKMLRLVKQKGSRAGLTSNATLLDEETIRKLVGEGLDILCLSVAGVDESSDAIRKGTSLQKVLSAIETIHKVRSSAGSALPHIHMAYMLLRSGVDDIKKMPVFFNSLGIDQIIVSGLTLALDPEMEKQMYLADTEEGFARIRDRLLGMKALLDEPETVFFHIFNPFLEGNKCSENIHKACYVSVDGDIRPCVYTDFPESDKNYARCLNARKYPVESVRFGNINEQPLGKIWRDPGYLAFRQNFFSQAINKPCLHCAKRFIDDFQTKT
jgi:MoaA/NifB/PqqE/SkfB family radical SAM enzyme